MMRHHIEESFVWYEIEFSAEEHYKFQVLKDTFNKDEDESPGNPKDAVRLVPAVDGPWCAFVVKQHLQEDWEEAFWKVFGKDAV